MPVSFIQHGRINLEKCYACLIKSLAGGIGFGNELAQVLINKLGLLGSRRHLSFELRRYLGQLIGYQLLPGVAIKDVQISLNEAVAMLRLRSA